MITKSLGTVTKYNCSTGEDSLGNKFNNIEQAIQAHIQEPTAEKAEKKEEKEVGTKEEWYDGSVDYWNKQPTTNDGVLGGYGIVHEVDIQTSWKILDDFQHQISGWDSAIDMGAGIGRIAKKLLIPRFKEVDLLEPAEVQIDVARTDVPEIKNFYCQGLQEFEFERKYDCVWVQWCLCYLTDQDLHQFLLKAKENLVEEFLEPVEECIEETTRKPKRR